MKIPPLHIHLTKPKNGELGSELVFKTLRVGFPTAHISVSLGEFEETSKNVKDVDQVYTVQYQHDLWLTRLILYKNEPFLICDPDVVFWDNIENEIVKDIKEGEDYLVGEFEPQFYEKWTKSIKVERLHTALMYIDPKLIKAKIEETRSKMFPKNWPFGDCGLNVETLVCQRFVVENSNKFMPLFYDTMAGIYQLIGGRAWGYNLHGLFEHCHCGSYYNILPRETYNGHKEFYEALEKDITLAKGIREQLKKFYVANRV